MNNIFEFPVKHALLDMVYDDQGFLLSNAATRITPIPGSEPMQYSLDLSTPGVRVASVVNVSVLTGTERELKRIGDAIKQINAGEAARQEGLFFGRVLMEDLDMLISRHDNTPKWLIQIINPSGRPWFNFSFSDQTAAEITVAIDHYDFSD